MISIRTLSILTRLTHLGFILGVVLWDWDEQKQRFVMCNSKKDEANSTGNSDDEICAPRTDVNKKRKLELFIRKTYSVFCISYRLLLLLYSSFMVMTVVDAPDSERAFALLLMCISIMAVPVHIQYLRVAPLVVEYINNLIDVNKFESKSIQRYFLPLRFCTKYLSMHLSFLLRISITSSLLIYLVVVACTPVVI
jgi:hypothetical protein